MTTAYKINVEYEGNRLPDIIINVVMEHADPGTWGDDHPLLYTCPIMAEHARQNVADTHGPRYHVFITPEGITR
jgi:hypothetical protein